RLDLGRFFAWTGAFLVIVAAGVLAYAIMDLQQAGVLPGPFRAAGPVDALARVLLTGWAGFPLRWAIDVSTLSAPACVCGVLLQAIVGFMPHMTWLQVLAWAVYVAVVGAFFLRGARRGRSRPKSAPADAAVHPSSLTPSSPGAA